jgi:hypothetical protein
MTTTVVPTLQQQLNNALPDELPDILRLMQFGNMVTPLKRVFTGLTSSATQVLTQIDATGETVGASNPNRLAALAVTALRTVTGGTPGARIVTDAGGTAGAPGANGPGIALISDDGTTLTFEAAVTAFTIEYIPRAAVSMTAAVSSLTGGIGAGIGTAP